MWRLLASHRSTSRLTSTISRPPAYRCAFPRSVHSDRGTPSDSSTISSSSLAAGPMAAADPMVDDAVKPAGGGDDALETLLRAPFQKHVARPPGVVFPWRHSEEPLPRFVPGTPEFAEQGLLLGGDLDTSNPRLDSMAAAKFFLGVPWYKMLFYEDWKADLAESMTWAFSQGTAALLSNVYRVPLGRISGPDLELRFEHGLGAGEHDVPRQPDSPEDGEPELELDVHRIMEGRLVGLFESAREFGKDTLQVRLEIRPSAEPAFVAGLFVFPFLSRSTLAKSPGYARRYQRMLNLMASNDTSDAMALIQEFIEEKRLEHTVICQVIVPCEELFCVRDAQTGLVVQGHGDEKFRTVLHLVRFEKVVTTRLRNDGGGALFPYRQEQGDWQITDIDDLLGGNLLL